MGINKFISYFLLTISLVVLQPSAFSAEEQASGVMDDSLRDISIVLGSGAVGALLGLSTLSFVETPSEHWKNVAVGGAVGIVIGVGVVIFSQATRSASAISLKEVPLNPEKFAALSRLEFSSQKIAQDYLKEPTIGYTFKF